MRVGRGFEIKAENGRVVVMPESVYWKVTGKGCMDRGVQKRSKGNDKRNSHSNGGTGGRSTHRKQTTGRKDVLVQPNNLPGLNGGPDRTNDRGIL